MILACQNISKSFADKTVLRNVNFHIEDKEKCAIVGINGAGKSTLLKIILGQEEADEGKVVLAKDIRLGYLSQHQDISFDCTVMEAMQEAKKYIIEMQEKIRSLENLMQHAEGDQLESILESYNRLQTKYDRENGYAYESEITGVLKGLGFSTADYDRHVNSLSGGQKMRIALGQILLQHPDLILLDEPTNHLDMPSIEWLQGFLSSYPGAVIVVSHDRYFIDHVATQIVEIDAGNSSVFHGSYSFYREERAKIRTARIKAYMKQQDEIKHEEAVIAKLKQFNREKSIKRAESREKRLDKIEVMEKPTEVNAEMRLRLTPSQESGEDVLTVEHMTKSFGDNVLFRDIAMDIKRGEHVALIGGNGTGKTTILKILNRMMARDEGTVTIGSHVQIGYFDQEHQDLDPNKSIFDEMSDSYPDMNNTKIRNVLAAFLFTGEDVFKKIGDLSGGEKGRLSLAKLMLSPANFLILDEPTNHLDIASKEILEEALVSYTGTVLYVSHDRYFINQTATRIMELTNQAVVNYIGDYDYYLEKKEELTSAYAPGIDSPEAPQEEKTVSENKLSWQQMKEEQAKKRKREAELKKVEARIEELETRDKEIDDTMVLPDVCTNVAECTKLSREKAAISEELEELYEKWEELA